MHEQIFPGITHRNKKAWKLSSSNYRYTDEYPKGRKAERTNSLGELFGA